jgi:hypothetical protein
MRAMMSEHIQNFKEPAPSVSTAMATPHPSRPLLGNT